VDWLYRPNGWNLTETADLGSRKCGGVEIFCHGSGVGVDLNRQDAKGAEENGLWVD
jgi:hypothetical protein